MVLVHQDHRCDLPGVTAGLVALRDNDVHAIVGVPAGVGSRAGQRRHRHPRRVGLVEDVGRW
jgi:hypothetical protein